MALPQQNTYTDIKLAYKTIKLRAQRKEIAAEIATSFKLSPVAARVLAARGYKADDTLRHYLSPTLKEGLPEPGKLKGLKDACLRVNEVSQAGGKIAICCDFDVDGLSGGAQLCHFLSTAGIEAKVFVPDRFEDGYGLNEKMVETIAEQGYRLLITIDYGTTNTKELTLAKKLGLSTIVIDHHHVGEAKPPCDVFVNPNQRGCGFADRILCASGLTWYFLMGLRQILPSAKEIDVRSYLDLACLGTICDMVPLVGANRVIAKRGLEILAQSSRPGILALKQIIGIKDSVSCFDVSFGIGPRLNAAGRMVHGDVVIELLTTSNNSSAQRIARELNALNLKRQDTEQAVKARALEEIQERGSMPAALVVWDESFHTGVIGIVAQRLVESFYRPAVVLGVDKEGVFKGSVRGVKGFSVVEALAAVGEHLIKYGGHDGAGGLSVAAENIQSFAEAFIQECETRLEHITKHPVAEADTEAVLEEVTLDLVQELKGFAPFGVGNPGPLLLLKGVTITDVRVLKDTHLKIILSDGKRLLTGMLWRQPEHPAVAKGKKVNVVCRPDTNTFQGVTSLQATIEAVE
jgi:single-stranded-DNA-specific exonuclease